MIFLMEEAMLHRMYKINLSGVQMGNKFALLNSSFFKKKWM